MATYPAERKPEIQPEDPHRRWDEPTKRIVAVAGILFLALVLYQFRGLLRPLLLAGLIAFIFIPVIDFFEDRIGMHRGIASGTLFLILLIAMLALLAAPVTAVPSIRRAILSAQLDLRQIIDDIGAFFSREIEIAGYEFDLSLVSQELSSALRRLVENLAQGTLDLVLSIASGAFWIFFILVVSFYLVKDAHRISNQAVQLAPPGYQRDAMRLRDEIVQVWNAFLRGQLLLGSVMGAVTAVVTAALGLPYPWALGLFAGFMEVIPNIGPVLAAIPSVLLALIQGSAFIPLGNFWFAVLVAGTYALLQLLENNLLGPRILGRTLELHPLAVLIAVLAGGQLAGILGILLAAPTLATFRVLGRYILSRLYDRDPFARLPVEEEELEVEWPTPAALKEAGEAALERLQERVRQAKEQYADDSDPTSSSD